jgi:multiple sugar transport system permease protein
MKKANKLDKKEKAAALLFVALPIAGFLIFTLGTMIFSGYYSFNDYNPVKDEMHWLGFKNYQNLFESVVYAEKFLNSIFNTLILLIAVPIGICIGLLYAALLNNRKIYCSKLLRIIYYLPAVSSVVALNIIWRYIFNSEYGILNVLLDKKIYWLSNNSLIKIAIIIKNVWGAIGGTLILYLAGMMNISSDYYEAADIDGASGFQKFKKITIPMITPITFYLLIMGIIGGLQSYADSQIFAQGDDGAQTIVYFIWSYGIEQSRYGIASAASLFLAVAIMAITLIQFKVSNRWVYEE